ISVLCWASRGSTSRASSYFIASRCLIPSAWTKIASLAPNGRSPCRQEIKRSEAGERSVATTIFSNIWIVLLSAFRDLCKRDGLLVGGTLRQFVSSQPRIDLD